MQQVCRSLQNQVEVRNWLCLYPYNHDNQVFLLCLTLPWCCSKALVIRFATPLFNRFQKNSPKRGERRSICSEERSFTNHPRCHVCSQGPWLSSHQSSSWGGRETPLGPRRVSGPLPVQICWQCQLFLWGEHTVKVLSVLKPCKRSQPGSKKSTL